MTPIATTVASNPDSVGRVLKFVMFLIIIGVIILWWTGPGLKDTLLQAPSDLVTIGFDAVSAGIEGTRKVIHTSVNIIPKTLKLDKTFKSDGKVAKGFKKAFCFHGNTLVALSNGRSIRMKDITIGDNLYNDNEVLGVMKFNGKNVKLVDNCGVVSTRNHHILSSDGIYRRAGETFDAKKVNEKVSFLYDLETTNHKIVCIGNNNEMITFTDFSEVDDKDDVIEKYELDILNHKYGMYRGLSRL